MLVLPCRVGRWLYVGHYIALTVVSIDGEEVQVGIDAPERVRVSRDDIPYDKHLKRQASLDRNSPTQEELLREWQRHQRRRRRS